MNENNIYNPIENKGLNGHQTKNRQITLMIIGVAILVIGLVGITYAFFNYTRTGNANVIKTGRISFNSEQTGNSINLTNVFPVDVSEGVPNNNSNVGEVKINITGDTEYMRGIEYLVSAVNVTNTVGNKTVPIGINVTATSGLGTSVSDYFIDRDNNPETSIYSVLASDEITNNEQLVVGYIKSGQTGVDGNIVIKAYIDANKVAISDTYPEGDVTHTEGEEPNQEEVTDYTNGTTTGWVNDRTVLTTTEWNSLQQNGVSFQVKVEANEGIWVTQPIPTIDSCPDCKFIYTTNTYYYDGSNYYPVTEVSSLTGVTTDYRTLNKNYFLGFTESDGKIDRAFACGIKAENPNQGTAFCVEGSSDGSTYGTNTTFLYDLYGLLDSGTNLGCDGNASRVGCYGEVMAGIANNGRACMSSSSGICCVEEDRTLLCGNY